LTLTAESPEVFAMATRTTRFTMSRRNELARQKGFVSYSQQRRFGREVDNGTALEALPPAAREVRQAALDALALARRERIDVGAAAERQGVAVEAVRWWTGDAATKVSGRWRPASADRLYRPMYVYSGGNMVPVDVRGSKVASKIGAYHSAVQHYLRTGDSTRLGRFSGARVGGVELETDLDVLDELGRRGEFDFESIYRMVD